MNILLVAEDFLINGVTRHIIDLANGLSEAGHNVFVASSPGIQKKQLNPSVSFIPLVLCHPDSDQKKITGIYKSLLILIKAVREHHIDIIHTHKRYADAIGRVAARLTGIEHISTCHNRFDKYRLLSPFGDMVIAPSDAIAKMLIDDFKFSSDRVKIVNHGIKPLRIISELKIHDQRRSLGLGDDIKVVLSVGHMNTQKDRPTLIEAVRLLDISGKIEKTVFLLVGEGEEKIKVHAMIHDYKLEDRIKLIPASSDVEALYNIAEFCVLSSIYEAGPYVILEAASLRRPSIGTAVGFIPSFMGHNEAGICVEPKSPQQLADAIDSLLSNPKRTAELGENAYKRFCQNYSYESFINNSLSIYEEVYSNKLKTGSIKK
jgi:glycosyltransferase involved in cell wall biosynthesis